MNSSGVFGMAVLVNTLTADAIFIHRLKKSPDDSTNLIIVRGS